MAGTRSTVAVFAADPSSSAQARKFVRDSLVRMGFQGKIVDTAILVVSELVTNAVLHAHAGPVITVHIENEIVRLEVEDNSELFPLLRNYSRDAITGRGLDVVEALANRWGVETTQNGKTVWVEFDPEAEKLEGESNKPQLPSSDDDIPVGNDTQFVVRFLQVPVSAFLALEQHHEALFREFELLLIAESQESANPLSPQVRDLVHKVRPILQERISNVRKQVAAAQDKGLDVCDLVGYANSEFLAWSKHFQELMTEADRLCDEGLLLTSPPTSITVELRRWFLDEIVRQYVDRILPRPVPASVLTA